MSDFLNRDLHTLLAGESAITDLVGTRIRPGRLMQGDALPALRYAVSSMGSVQHLTGISGTATPSLQIDCYAATWAGAWTLSEAVRLLLSTYRGTVGDTFVEGITLANRLHAYEDPVDASDTGKHRWILTFDVAHDEATS